LRLTKYVDEQLQDQAAKLGEFPYQRTKPEKISRAGCSSAISPTA